MDIDPIPNFFRKAESSTRMTEENLIIPRPINTGSFAPLLEQFDGNPSGFLNNVVQTREALVEASTRIEELSRENKELRNELAWFHVQHAINTSLTAQTTEDDVNEWPEVVLTGDKSCQSNNIEEVPDENNNFPVQSPTQSAKPPEFPIPTMAFNIRVELVTSTAKRGSKSRERDVEAEVKPQEASVNVTPDLDTGVINVDVSNTISIPEQTSSEELGSRTSESEALISEAEQEPNFEALQSESEGSTTDEVQCSDSSTQVKEVTASTADGTQPQSNVDEATAPNQEILGHSAKEVTFNPGEPIRIEPIASTDSLHYPKLEEDRVVDTEEPPTPEPVVPPPIIRSTTGIVRQVPSLTLGKSKIKPPKAKKPSMLKNMWGAKPVAGHNMTGTMNSNAPVTAQPQQVQQAKKVILKKKQRHERAVPIPIPSPVIAPAPKLVQNTQNQKDKEDTNKPSTSGYNPFLDD